MIRLDHSTDTDADIIFEGGKTFEINYIAGVQFTPGSPEAIAFLENALQAQTDVRQRLNTLPSDDRDRTIDPARPNLFWDGPGQPGNTDLVGRSTVYTVTWDGEKYQYSSGRARFGNG